MSLPITNLDNRTFQDIVDDARRRMAMLCPEWTNPELSDPGVALIELFAWMSEMVIYRLNQVPDVFYTRMLNLMGVQPFPPRAAQVAVTFFVAQGFTETVRIPSGTEIASSGDEPIVFTTLSDATVQQPTLIYAMIAGADGHFVHVWEELESAAAEVEFLAAPATSDDAFLLGFTSSLAGSVIRLDIDVAMLGIGVGPDEYPWQWEAWSGEGWVTAYVLSDSSQLCRAGAIVLQLPTTHGPFRIGDIGAYWIRVRLNDADRFSGGAPRIRSLVVAGVGVTVAAEHSTVMLGEVLGFSDGRAGQRFATRAAPVLARRPDETVRVFDDGLAGPGVADWQEVDSFASSGPDDRHFTWDSSTGEICFGPAIRNSDGTVRSHGAVPSAGAQITVTEYRHGGGAMGNVGAGSLTTLRSSLPGVAAAENRSRAIGGVDAESIDNTKLRGPLVLRSGQHAVTAEDYERHVLEARPDIARVRCVRPHTPGGPIRVLIVPHIDERPACLDSMVLSHEMLMALIDHLGQRSILGVQVELCTPFYQGVSVVARLTARPGRPANLVRAQAMDAVTRLLDPITGGSDGRGWPFDSDLRASTIAQLLGGLEGVEYVDEVALFEFDLRNGKRLGLATSLVRLQSDALFMSAQPQIVVR